ncbi:unnamed protein product, partial [Staurois parvus]
PATSCSAGVAGIAPHHWLGGGRNSAPSLVSGGGGGIVPHRWCQWGGRNSAPSLVSVGGEE